MRKHIGLQFGGALFSGLKFVLFIGQVQILNRSYCRLEKDLSAPSPEAAGLVKTNLLIFICCTNGLMAVRKRGNTFQL